MVEVVGTVGAVGKDGIVGSVEVPGITVVVEEPAIWEEDPLGREAGREAVDCALLPEGEAAGESGRWGRLAATAHRITSKKVNTQIRPISSFRVPGVDIDICIAPLSVKQKSRFYWWSPAA